MPNPRIDLPFSRFEEDWSGKEAFVIGGGPSLSGFDFSVLPKDQVTIGANKSAFVANTDVLCSVDKLFSENCKGDIRFFKGLAVLGSTRTSLQVVIEEATYLKVDRKRTISRDRERICGLNSGFASMNLASLGNCKKIHLLGIDMKMDDVKHFHGGYHWSNGTGDYKGWSRYFDKAAKEYEKDGVEVIQYVGPIGTGLDCFPQKPLTELDPNYPT